MITTTPNTPLLQFDVNGEDHTNGWTFSLTSYGIHDHYFVIVDNFLTAGPDYIPPGHKFIQVIFENSNGINEIADIEIPIKDNGILIPVGDKVFIPGNTLPIFADDYSLTMSWYRDVGNGVADIINTHVKIAANGTLQLFDYLNNLLFDSGVKKFNAGRWHTIFITREDRGDGIKTYYKIDDTDLYEDSINHLIDFNTSDIDFGVRQLGLGDLVISNIKLNINNIVYINEELDSGIGILSNTANVVFNTSKQQI